MKSWLKHPRKTECDNVREWLSPYLDDELDAGERQRVTSHLESCQACREELDSLRKTVSLVRRMPVIEPRHSFAISEAVKKTWDGMLKVLCAATTLVAIFLVLVFIGDIGHYFDAPILPAPPWPQLPQVAQYYWPVRETEFALLGVFVALVVVTIVYWRKRVGKLLRHK